MTDDELLDDDYEPIFAGDDCNVDIITPTKTLHSLPSLPSLPTPPPSLPTSPPLDEDRVCRICLVSEDEEGPQHFIHPCSCAGSQKFVHLTCLNSWRANAANATALSTCLTCGFKYNVTRSHLALFICQPLTHSILSVSLLLILSFLTGGAAAAIYPDLLKVFYQVAGGNWWLANLFTQTFAFQRTLLGLALVSNAYYLPHLYGDLTAAIIMFQAGDQKHLVLFAAWLGSMSQSSHLAVRLAMVGGSLMAWRVGKEQVKVKLQQYSFNVCERILNNDT